MPKKPPNLTQLWRTKWLVQANHDLLSGEEQKVLKRGNWGGRRMRKSRANCSIEHNNHTIKSLLGRRSLTDPKINEGMKELRENLASAHNQGRQQSSMNRLSKNNKGRNHAKEEFFFPSVMRCREGKSFGILGMLEAAQPGRSLPPGILHARNRAKNASRCTGAAYRKRGAAPHDSEKTVNPRSLAARLALLVQGFCRPWC